MVNICTYWQAVAKGLCSGGERMYGVGDNSFIAYEGDKRLGEISFFSRYQDSYSGNYDTLQITTFDVTKKYRRRGIGSRLLQELVDNYGVNIMGLHTEVDNPARILYERFGFKVMSQGVDAKRYGLTPEEAKKIIYMERPAQEGQGKKLKCSQREYYHKLNNRIRENRETIDRLKEAVNA